MRGDLDHAHRAVVALFGEKAVIEQLQFHRARREPGGAEHDESEHQTRAPATTLGGGFARALLHGRTIRTSRVCGRFICSLAFATRSTKACEDQKLCSSCRRPHSISSESRSALSRSNRTN